MFTFLIGNFLFALIKNNTIFKVCFWYPGAILFIINSNAENRKFEFVYLSCDNTDVNIITSEKRNKQIIGLKNKRREKKKVKKKKKF